MRSGLLAMGGLVEAQLERALEAIASADTDVVEQVVREEKRVNDAQIELDRKYVEVIAKRQPTAVDLRQIVGTMQAVNDLERIGDEIKKIALRAQQFQASERFQHLRLNEARHIGALVQDMLGRSTQCLRPSRRHRCGRGDWRDTAVDEEFERIMRLLVSYMMEDPAPSAPDWKWRFLAKAIERVADHAKNISEYVIHIVQGQDPRHAG